MPGHLCKPAGGSIVSHTASRTANRKGKLRAADRSIPIWRIMVNGSSFFPLFFTGGDAFSRRLLFSGLSWFLWCSIGEKMAWRWYQVVSQLHDRQDYQPSEESQSNSWERGAENGSDKKARIEGKRFSVESIKHRSPRAAGLFDS